MEEIEEIEEILQKALVVTGIRTMKTSAAEQSVVLLQRFFTVEA